MVAKRIKGNNLCKLPVMEKDYKQPWLLTSSKGSCYLIPQVRMSSLHSTALPLSCQVQTCATLPFCHFSPAPPLIKPFIPTNQAEVQFGMKKTEQEAVHCRNTEWMKVMLGWWYTPVIPLSEGWGNRIIMLMLVQATEQVPGHSCLHGETLSQEIKTKNKACAMLTREFNKEKIIT